MTNAGIYQIRNISNGKRYVGSSVDLKRRQRDHFGKLRNNSHYNPILQNAFNKHGEESFVFEVLEFTGRDETRTIEQKYIDSGEFDYNISGVASGGFDFKNHPDREEIYAKRNQSRIGSKRTKASRKRMSEAQSGERNHKFSGYFQTPWGVFPSANSASKANGNVSYVTLLDICKNPDRQITNQAYKCSKFLRQYFDATAIDKTYRELGFSHMRALKD